MLRELVPDVLTWSWFSARHGYDFNGLLVRHADGNLCIDPVEPGEGTLAAMAREGVSRVLLTNRNHVRAAEQVRERTGAPIAIHSADADHARGQGATISAELRAGERCGPFLVLPVPGKSPGEVALHWPERRLLVVGDALIGNPPGRLGLLPDRVMDDPDRLRESIRTLTSLDLDTILVGDGVAILEDAGARLRELVATFPAEDRDGARSRGQSDK
jgi:glyoxylase-like metal-dependent hydrolase (beta-lactamase superfamily II)